MRTARRAPRLMRIRGARLPQGLRRAPQPRASPGGGRPAAIPHRLGRTRAGSKLSAGPPRGAAQHRQPQNGAERACGASTVKIRLHFLASGIRLMLVNLKVANNLDRYNTTTSHLRHRNRIPVALLEPTAPGNGRIRPPDTNKDRLTQIFIPNYTF